MTYGDRLYLHLFSASKMHFNYVKSIISSSNRTEDISATFALIFTIVWGGGSLVTINSQLLGAKMYILIYLLALSYLHFEIRSLNQSLCVLGYCLFPYILCSSVITYLHHYMNHYLKLAIGMTSFAWSSLCNYLQLKIKFKHSINFVHG